jgi:pimeloyl-ACP methyl ester carboxylesterase
MQTYVFETSRGPVAMVADGPRPDTLLIHGFRRSPAHLREWARRIPGAGLVALPGHGGTPELAEVSVEAWIAAWREALPQIGADLTLIGESLGAMVAMSLPARITVAVEPLLSVDDIWPQHEVMRRAKARGVDIGPAYEALFDRSYDWVLDRISAPTLVIGGDMPLLPQRPLPTAPSLLTDDDFARYAGHPLVEAHRIPGGHTLLDENPGDVVRLLRSFFARHGWRAGPPAQSE